MGAVNTLQVSSLQAVGKTIGWPLRFIALVVLYFILFAFGGGLVAPYLPMTPAEAGPVPEMTGLLIVSMSVAFFLVMTLVTQLEAWYFNMGRWRLSNPPWFPAAIVANRVDRWAGAQRTAKHWPYPAEFTDPAKQCAHEPFDRNSFVHLCLWPERDVAVVPQIHNQEISFRYGLMMELRILENQRLKPLLQ